jgi:predicted AlkP superfamily pyrophosphatase or phosphodiesterase
MPRGRALALVLASLILCSARPAIAQDRIGLVVLIVVDQLGSETFSRWSPVFEGGFAALRRRGAYYPNGLHDQASTATGPGHTTIVTGAWPNIHGIVSNSWYDPKDGALLYCAQDSKHGLGPELVMAPTIGDQVRSLTGGRGKVVSLAVKDRVGVLMAGERPSLAAWYDSKSGVFVSGKWYGGSTPAWLDRINSERSAQRSFGAKWERMAGSLDYVFLAGPDDPSYEGKIPGLGNTFPHVLGSGLEATDQGWLDIYRGTPAAMETLFEVAKTAVDEEQLGRDDAPDLLFLGVSTLDFAGHYYGPSSQEALDVALRIDRALGTFMKHVESRLGGGRVVWMLTGDHGVSIVPEAAAQNGVRAKRWLMRDIEPAVNEALKPLARKGQPATKLILIDPPLMYLSHDDPGADRLALQRAAANALRSHPAFLEVWASADVERFVEPFRTRYRRALFPGREPDLLYRGHPGDLIEMKYETGSNHGSPYTYDTNVPILIAGPRITKSEDPRPYPVTAIAPTIAAILGMPPPAAALESPLPAVY